MLRYLLPFIELGLLVFALIDAAQTPEAGIRNLGKGWWILLIILVPIAGPIAWLVAGRPVSTSPGPRGVPWPSRTAGYPESERPRSAPDDDPEFLAQLGGRDSSHEEMLKQWEADLRAREQQMRRDAESGHGKAGDSDPTGSGPAQ